MDSALRSADRVDLELAVGEIGDNCCCRVLASNAAVLKELP